MPVKRRQLLPLALLPWLAGSLRGAGRAASSPTSNADVIVIGAGMAGLACAQQLRKQGYSVIVLEARDRIGGRTWTDDSLGVPVDLGGAWIHGVDGNPLTALAAAAGAATVATDWDSQQLYASSRTVTSPQQEAAEALLERVIEHVLEQKEDADASDSLGDAFGAATAELLEDDETGAAVQWQLWSMIGSEYGEEAERLSLASWDEDEELPGEHVLLKPGYSALLKQLARGLDIRLKQVVQRVEHAEDGAQVNTDQGVFSADAVVCTLPLGVLKSTAVRFEPPLPERHQAAVQRLGTGALDKVVLRFPRVFWPAHAHTFARIDGDPERRCEFYNLHLLHQQPILVALTGGDYSRSLEAMSETDVVQLMMAELRAIFGDDIPAPEQALRTRWASDPFARGSYSLVPPGASLQDFATLARPAGPRLIMAGEATSREYPGTVHGAYLSGLRAAAEVEQLEHATLHSYQKAPQFAGPEGS